MKPIFFFTRGKCEESGPQQKSTVKGCHIDIIPATWHKRTPFTAVSMSGLSQKYKYKYFLTILAIAYYERRKWKLHVYYTVIQRRLQLHYIEKWVVSCFALALNEGNKRHVTNFWLQLVNFLVLTFWTSHQWWLPPNSLWLPLSKANSM